MDEPRRHVVEDYPVERLPDDLRTGFERDSTVTVIVESGRSEPSHSMTFSEIFETFATKDYGTTADEATERIRKLRDEWDDDA